MKARRPAASNWPEAADDRFGATHMFAFEGDCHVEWFQGNFAAYEEDKERRLGIDSVVPHRLKY